MPMTNPEPNAPVARQFDRERFGNDVTFARAKNVVLRAEHATFINPKLLPPGFAPGRGWRFGHPRPGLLRRRRCFRA